MRELITYWTTNTHAAISRIEYQMNKAGHSLLIGLAVVALCQLLTIPVHPVVIVTAAAVLYWLAGFPESPLADHVHTAEHPVTHYTAKLLAGLLAPVLLVALVRPWVLVVWFVVYLPVLLFRL